MLWLTVKCANCADLDFQATTQVICDCSNHIILDVHSLDYRYWEQRGFLFFYLNFLTEPPLIWIILSIHAFFFFNPETRFTMELSLRGDKRLFYELQITGVLMYFFSMISWVSDVYCTCVTFIFVYMLLCFMMKTLAWLFPSAPACRPWHEGWLWGSCMSCVSYLVQWAWHGGSAVPPV